MLILYTGAFILYTVTMASDWLEFLPPVPLTRRATYSAFSGIDLRQKPEDFGPAGTSPWLGKSYRVPYDLERRPEQIINV